MECTQPTGAAVRRAFSSIEPLEPRIAPAAVFTFTDVDGDTVVVTTSKGTNEQLAGALKLANVGLGQQLREIDFSTVAKVNGVNPFEGTNLTVKVTKKSATGDGRVNVGYIDASSLDGASMQGDGEGLSLGAVKVMGDLGQIDAGTGGFGPAIKTLNVQSIGAFEVATQGANGSLTSNILGKVGTFKVVGSVYRATLIFTAPTTMLNIGGVLASASIAGVASFGTISIGSIVDGSDIEATSIAKLMVRGGIIGLASINQSMISVTGELKSASIKGGMFGARISAGSIGAVTVGGSLVALAGMEDSGTIYSAGRIGSVAIRGDLIASPDDNTGRVMAAGDIGKVTVGGSIIGPDVPDIVRNAGGIFSSGNIGTVVIGGDMVGPRPAPGVPGAKEADRCTTIRATGDIKSVVIGGSIQAFQGFVAESGETCAILGRHIGSVTVYGSIDGASPILPRISGFGGDGVPAIGKVVVKGDVRAARIIGGVGDLFANAPRTADAEIGSITVGGNVDSVLFQTGLKGGNITDSASRIGKIGAVKIGGTVTGTSTIAAEEFGSVTIGGNKLRLNPGPSNDTTAIPFLPGQGTVIEYM